MEDKPLSGKQKSFNPGLFYKSLGVILAFSIGGVSIHAFMNRSDFISPKKEISKLEKILNQKTDKKFFNHETWLATTFSGIDYDAQEILKTAAWTGGNIIYVSPDISKKSIDYSKDIMKNYNGNQAYIFFNIESLDELNRIKKLLPDIKKEYNGIIISGVEIGNILNNPKNKKKYDEFETSAKIYKLSTDISVRFLKNNAQEGPEEKINPSRTYFVSSYQRIN